MPKSAPGSCVRSGPTGTFLRLAAIAVIGVLLMAIAPLPAAIADGGTAVWSIAPGRSSLGSRQEINYTLIPGANIEDSVEVKNLSHKPLTLNLYAADAAVTNSGAFTVLPAGSTSRELGSWIALDRDRIKLSPGESAQIPFTITIPDDASPGDHAAGILASARVEAADGDGAALAIDQRVGTRVYVRVDGPLSPRLQVSDLHIDYSAATYPMERREARIHYTITNTGNLRLAGRANITLSGPLGRNIASSPAIEIPPLLPGSSVEGDVDIPVQFPPPRLKATLEVDGINVPGTVPSSLPHERATAIIWAVPWLLTGVIAALVALLLVRVSRKRSRERAHVQVPDRAAEADATIPT